MTDRINAVTVILEDDIRIDDAEEGVLTALRSIRGVLRVVPHVATIDSVVEQQRARSEIRERLYELMEEWR